MHHYYALLMHGYATEWQTKDHCRGTWFGSFFLVLAIQPS